MEGVSNFSDIFLKKGVTIYLFSRYIDKGGEQMQDMESLYQEYAKQVYRYLFTLCHEEHMAEELTQETFYRAVKSIKNYDGTCKIYVWLCQIGKHVWYQELDRQRRKGTLELEENLISTKRVWKRRRFYEMKKCVCSDCCIVWRNRCERSCI